MWGRLIAALAGLNRRERLLLAVLVGVALPVGAVFAVVLPMQEARAAARVELAEARALDAWVARQARLYGSLSAAAPEEETPAPIGISGIEASLVGAGLRDAVSELSNRGSGAVSLRFDEVRFTRLIEWLSETHPDWGYALAAMEIERLDAPDRVAVTLSLEPAG